MPAFLSIFTDTDASWLQKRHEKDVGRGSFCLIVSLEVYTMEDTILTFFGPCGFLEDFFRFP